MSEWKPIETAPTDGDIIGFDKHGNVHRISYHHTSKDGLQIWETWNWNEDWFFPTHWMPLPKPPEE